MTIHRRYRFSASHRLHAAGLPEAENRQIFGKCNNPFGHGHNYILEVHVAGPVDAETGLVVNIEALDGLVNDRFLAVAANHDLNRLDWFKGRVSTTENLARVAEDVLRSAWSAAFPAPGPQLNGVRVMETRRNTIDTSGARQ